MTPATPTLRGISAGVSVGAVGGTVSGASGNSAIGTGVSGSAGASGGGASGPSIPLGAAGAGPTTTPDLGEGAGASGLALTYTAASRDANSSSLPALLGHVRLRTVSKKRSTLSAGSKRTICEIAEENPTYTHQEVADAFELQSGIKVERSTCTRAIKRSADLLEMPLDDPLAKRKKVARFPVVDDAVFELIRCKSLCAATRATLNEQRLTSFAKTVADQLGITHFKASPMWVRRLRERRGLRDIRPKANKLSAFEAEAYNIWPKPDPAERDNIISNFLSFEDVYNLDATTLIFAAGPAHINWAQEPPVQQSAVQPPLYPTTVGHGSNSGTIPPAEITSAVPQSGSIPTPSLNTHQAFISETPIAHPLAQAATAGFDNVAEGSVDAATAAALAVVSEEAAAHAAAMAVASLGQAQIFSFAPSSPIQFFPPTPANSWPPSPPHSSPFILPEPQSFPVQPPAPYAPTSFSTPVPASALLPTPGPITGQSVVRAAKPEDACAVLLCANGSGKHLVEPYVSCSRSFSVNPRAVCSLHT
jgi:hypothetical protein